MYSGIYFNRFENNADHLKEVLSKTELPQNDIDEDKKDDEHMPFIEDISEIREVLYIDITVKYIIYFDGSESVSVGKGPCVVEGSAVTSGG